MAKFIEFIKTNSTSVLVNIDHIISVYQTNPDVKGELSIVLTKETIHVFGTYEFIQEKIKRAQVDVPIGTPIWPEIPPCTC